MVLHAASFHFNCKILYIYNIYIYTYFILHYLPLCCCAIPNLFFIFPDKLSERTHVSWPHARVVGIMGGFSSGLMAEVHGKTADAKCAAAPETKVGGDGRDVPVTVSWDQR